MSAPEERDPRGESWGGAAIVAVGAVSPWGLGDEAFHVGEPGERARVAIRRDEELVRAGLARPFAARAPLSGDRHEDRATTLLARALGDCARELDRSRPGWRHERVGLVVGTSSGGMSSAEQLFACIAAGQTVPKDLARASTYFGPLAAATERLGVRFHPCSQILGACASSTLALGIALRWLELGSCDLVLAGGYDGVSLFVAAGFEVLKATSASRPSPFRIGRDGMALGEGAAIVALAPEPRDASRGRGFVLGFGAGTDAVHVTAPDRTGLGLASAASSALRDAGLAPLAVDLVSPHATATPFNDAAEQRALAHIFDYRPLPLVHPVKAQIGHTLGAAGVLESLCALDACERSVGPAAAGEGELDPDCEVPLLERNDRRILRNALKLSSAFGGANGALVLGRTPVPRARRAPRSVHVCARTTLVERPSSSQVLPEHVKHPNPGRIDPLGRFVLVALVALLEHAGPAARAGAGLVVGHGLATLEHNASFDARRRERGARHVEPRRFPATSPNVSVGECAIALGLHGPSFAVGATLAGGLEALRVARDLVAAGDAERMLVVGVDIDGPVGRALLVSAEWPPIREGATAVLLSAESAHGSFPLPEELPPARAAGGWASLAAALDELAGLRY